MITITRQETDHDELDALRHLPGLASLNERRLRALLASFDRATVAAGTRLATAGRGAAELFVVIDGCLRTEGGAGPRDIGPGEAVGWETLAADASWPVSVTATRPTQLLVMGRAQFRALRAVGQGLARSRS